MTNKYTYHVEMTCDGCSNAVKRVLDKNGAGKIKNVDINLADKLVTVESTELSRDEIGEILKKTGKTVTPQ